MPGIFIEEYIHAALIIEPKGIYYFFWSYIKYDYCNRNFFSTKPSYQEALQMATDNGVSEFDKEQLFSILAVPRPDCL